MPTNNPKISGYIPQAVYNCLIKFQEERKVSISQAVTIVLSEYFGVNQGTNQLSPAGVTLAQLQKLEQRIQELEYKIKLVDVPSSLLVDQSRLESKMEKGSLDSELLSDLEADIPEVAQSFEQDENDVPINSNIEPQVRKVEDSTEAQQQSADNNLLSELASEPIEQKLEEGFKNQKVTFSVDLIPLSAIELSERLKVDRSAISRYKNGGRKQSLSEWSKTLDPDGVAWEYSKKHKKYIPSTYSELNTDLLSGLS